MYLHLYAGTVSALPSGATLQTRESTWPLQPSSMSAQEDESVTMSISVIAALTSVKSSPGVLACVDTTWNPCWHPQSNLTHRVYAALTRLFYPARNRVDLSPQCIHQLGAGVDLSSTSGSNFRAPVNLVCMFLEFGGDRWTPHA